MKTGILVLIAIFVIVGLALAQDTTQPAFTLNPANGYLTAIALEGDVRGGSVEIWVDGQFLTTATFTDLAMGESSLLAIVDNPQSVETWQIRGDYTYTWGNGGLWEPTLDLPDTSPNGTMLPTVDFSQYATPPHIGEWQRH